MAQGAQGAATLDGLLRSGKLAGSWTLDPSRSQIGLRSKSMWGLAKVTGVFRQVSGSGDVTATGEASGTVTVAAASIDTSNKRRDAHLRSADFFDVGNYPDITFRVDGISRSGEGVKVAGTLTVGTTARKMSFDAQVSVPDGSEVWLDAELQVNRADFGLTWNQMGMASMENTIAIHAVFVR